MEALIILLGELVLMPVLGGLALLLEGLFTLLGGVLEVAAIGVGSAAGSLTSAVCLRDISSSLNR